MPPEYDLSPDALNDVLELTERVGNYSDEALERFVDTLYDAFERLAAFPGMGKTREDLSPCLRSFPVNKHRVTIFYVEPDEARPFLLIARVFRQERDVGEDDFLY